jgi:hypothetical protein
VLQILNQNVKETKLEDLCNSKVVKELVMVLLSNHLIKLGDSYLQRFEDINLLVIKVTTERMSEIKPAETYDIIKSIRVEQGQESFFTFDQPDNLAESDLSPC